MTIFTRGAGFTTVLKRIADVWRSRKNEIVEQSADTMRQLSEAIQPQGPAPSPVYRSVLVEAKANLLTSSGIRNGPSATPMS